MRESFLVKIESDPVARIWGGVGDLAIAGDGTYFGAGELGNLPDYQQLINGVAERLDVTLSGVTAETLRLALEDKDTVEGATVRIGSALFNDDWSLASVTWEGTYRADKLTVDRTNGGDSPIRSITLSIASSNTNRSRAPLAFWTDADQRRRSSDDAIFSHVGKINGGTSRRFGPAS